MPKKNIDLEAKKMFFNKVACLNGEDEVTEFFQDICSSAEIKDFARRLLAAKMLFDNKTYLEITDQMGMSAGTINKIHFKTHGSPLLHRLLEE